MFAVLENFDETWVRLRFSFNRSAVDALKVVIPSYARRWVPEQKSWLIRCMYVATATDLLESCGYTIQDNSDVGAVFVERNGNSPSAVLETLFKSSPIKLRHKLFRQLTMVFHPDTGGDDEWMKALNHVWQSYEP